jgi:branched-chain amino acid transport system substrate-binding protein
MEENGMAKLLAGVLSFILLSAAAFPALGQTKPAGRTTAPIKIGGSLALTGLWGESTKWVKDGYDFWVEDVNRRGGLLGRPVELVVYDNESDADKAVTYYERAITVDKVDLVYGSTPGSANVAVMPLVEKYGKVFIGLGGHMKSFEQGFTYSFASPPLMGDWTYLSLAGAIDGLLPKGDRPKTMAILTMNNVSGISCRVPMVKWAEENGIKVIVDETYNLPLTDATPLVSKAKMRGADILVCSSAFDDGVMITRACKSVRYNPKILWQQVGSLIPAWMKELGNDGNNVLNNTFWHPSLPFAGNKEINEGAKRRLGIPEAPLFFGFGYCWMKTLELAVQGAGTLDQKKIRDYLRSSKFDLPYGKGVTFDARGLPPAFSFCTQTTNGKVELVWPQELATTKFVYPRPSWN